MLSKRFGIATKIRVCPTLSTLRQKYFYSTTLTNSFAEFSVTALFKEFSVALACLFSPQKCCAISAEFSRCERYCHLVMVEREVTFPNSTSKPCLIVSHHTAPDVDTLFVSRNKVTTPCFRTSTFRAICLR